jgi:hypothetical protein
VLDNTRCDSTTRFVQLDLLGGWFATRSPASESGPAAGIDLSFQLSAFRLGARLVKGFGDARDASMLLAHLGLVGGATPEYRDATECGEDTGARSSPIALGFDVAIAGYGFSDELGYLATGLGVEGLWHVTALVDALVRADLVMFPGGDRERTIDQALLAGVRVDMDTAPAANGPSDSSRPCSPAIPRPLA